MIFYVALLLVAFQRLGELTLSASNVAHLKRHGAFEVGREHYPWMVSLHFLWFVSMISERAICRMSPGVWVALLGLFLVISGQLLRNLAIVTLGRRWTTRVFILPDQPRVKQGVFSFCSHPNYLGVCLEICGLPLLGGCWRTSLVFTALNLALLAVRLRAEESALQKYCGNPAGLDCSLKPQEAGRL